MKTAMQELWDYIDANYHEKGFNLYNAKEISLEKEKEQIRNAYNDGYFAAYKYKDWEEYYKQNFNQMPELRNADGTYGSWGTSGNDNQNP
jgi:predicted proteasome-type protease